MLSIAAWLSPRAVVTKQTLARRVPVSEMACSSKALGCRGGESDDLGIGETAKICGGRDTVDVLMPGRGRPPSFGSHRERDHDLPRPVDLADHAQSVQELLVQ